MTKLTHGNFEGNITIKNGEVPATPALKALKFMDKYFPQDSRNGESGEVIETIRTALKKSAHVDGLVKALNYFIEYHSYKPTPEERGNYLLQMEVNKARIALKQFSGEEK